MSLEISEGERISLKQDLYTPHFENGRFNFLNDHFGLRKQCIHLLMGTSGQGKTTLSRSVIYDVAKNYKVFNYCSEETLEQTKTMFALRGTENEVLKNILFYHESTASTDSKDNIDEWLRILEVKIMNSKTKIFFFDNITTSKFYDPMKPDVQSKVVDGLMKILKSCDVPGFFVAHTANGVKDDQQALFSTSDIRGGKAITNRAEFVYAYQKFTGAASSSGETSPTYGTIRNLKARNYDVGHTYLLSYDFNKREYTGDIKIPNTRFKEIYDARFKLSGK